MSSNFQRLNSAPPRVGRPAPAPASHSPAVSACYLGLLFSQWLAKPPSPFRSFHQYLQICSQWGLQPGQVSLALYKQITQAAGIRFSLRLDKFSVFYERLGHPPLLSANCLNDQLHWDNVLADEVLHWFLHWQVGYWSRPRMVAYRAAWQDYLRYVAEQHGTDCRLTLDRLNQYGEDRRIGRTAPVVMQQRLLVLQHIIRWMTQRNHGLSLSQTLQSAGEPGAVVESAGGVNRTSRLRKSKPAYWEIGEYGINWAAPLVRSFLKRGIPLHQISTLRCKQIKINNRDEVRIDWLLDETATDLLAPQASYLLHRYLRATLRYNEFNQLNQERFFHQPNWDRFWQLVRGYLRVQKPYYQQAPIYRDTFASLPSTHAWVDQINTAKQDSNRPWIYSTNADRFRWLNSI